MPGDYICEISSENEASFYFKNWESEKKYIDKY